MDGSETLGQKLARRERERVDQQIMGLYKESPPEVRELMAIAVRMGRELGGLRTELAERQFMLATAVDGWRKALQLAQRRYICRPKYFEALKLHEAEFADFEEGFRNG